MNVFSAKRPWVVILLAGCLSWGCVGCSSWKFGDSLPSLDPQVRREREIARRVKNDPFPAAGRSANKPLK